MCSGMRIVAPGRITGFPRPGEKEADEGAVKHSMYLVGVTASFVGKQRGQ